MLQKSREIKLYVHTTEPAKEKADRFVKFEGIGWIHLDSYQGENRDAVEHYVKTGKLMPGTSFVYTYDYEPKWE